jgi:hypothetical protein
MQHLDAALQQVDRVPLGILADAWQPFPLLRFERHLPFNEGQLQVMASSVPQCTRNDPYAILHTLKKWREKYLAQEQQGAPPHQLGRIKDTVEALRARAYLLYQQERSVKWLQNTRVSDSWLQGASGVKVKWVWGVAICKGC